MKLDTFSSYVFTQAKLALLRAHRPPRRERSVRFQLPALHLAADAAAAMASITAAVAVCEITPGEAAELPRLERVRQTAASVKG
jgi:hypothetical protein